MEIKQIYPQRDHPTFAAAGANAFALEKYLQIQSKLNCNGQDIGYKVHKVRKITRDLQGSGVWGFLPQEIFELLHALRSILVHFVTNKNTLKLVLQALTDRSMSYSLGRATGLH